MANTLDTLRDDVARIIASEMQADRRDGVGDPVDAANEVESLVLSLVWKARASALLDAAHGISLIGASYLDRHAVIRALEQWGADPDRLVPRPAAQEQRCRICGHMVTGPADTRHDGGVHDARAADRA